MLCGGDECGAEGLEGGGGFGCALLDLPLRRWRKVVGAERTAQRQCGRLSRGREHGADLGGLIGE